MEGEPRLVSTLASEADLFIWVVESAAYMYRLCLEYARLWADDREAMSFKP